MSIKEGNDQKVTDSTRFLVRGLGLTRTTLKKQGFINAYIDDVIHEPHYVRSVYLLFKPEDLGLFEEFLQAQRMESGLIAEDYDYPEGYVVVVYNFPALYWRDYTLFLEGKYSKFSKGFKSLFPKEKSGVTRQGIPYKEPSFYAHIFDKSEVMRRYWEERFEVIFDDDQEYWNIPDLSRETLNIGNI